MLIDYSTGKMVRPGSINRIPNYVTNYDNKSERKWEFQSPKNSIISINNISHLRHFKTPSSEEFRKFRKIKIFPQPDSKRTLQSKLLPENPIKRRPPIKRYIIPKKEYTFHKKRASEYVYNNNFTLDNTDNHKFLKINKSKVRRIKTLSPLYIEYNNKSQITLLPGSIKRKEENIKDEFNELQKKQRCAKKFINKNNNRLNGLKSDNLNIFHKKNNFNTLNNNNIVKSKNVKKEKININNKMPKTKIKRNFKISINDDDLDKQYYLNCLNEYRKKKNKNL